MPKRYAARPIAERGEANLARRVERERKVRGWSYETLAKEMTEAGCKISKAALFSIEQGDPPRRITVDELTAFAEVFGEPVADLLRPIALLDQERAHELLEEIKRCLSDSTKLASETFNALRDFYVLAYENNELAEYVAHQLDSINRVHYTLDWDDGTPEGDLVGNLAVLRLADADIERQTAMRQAAWMLAAYQSGSWTDDDRERAEAEFARLSEKHANRIEED